MTASLNQRRVANLTTMINKVVYGQAILLDLTSDTVAAAHLDSGYTAHDASGATITGTSTKDADTSDGTASVADILSGKTAYAGGAKLTGTMANRGAVNGTISAKAESYTVAEGYHNGSGSVSIDATEQDKIIPENIKDGINILGVTGSYSGSGADTSDATASPSDILSDKTAYVSSGKVTGTMANNGAVSGTIATASGSYTVPAGYHNGSGSVSIDSSEQAKITPENIRAGVSILGVTGAINTAALEPTTLRCGWIGTGNGVWTHESPTDSLADMYEVTAGHEYWLTLGASVGTRFRAIFTTVDVSTVTSGTVQGTALNTKNISDPPPFQSLWYTPSEDGYIVVQKDNVGNTNVKTYLYDKTASWV